MYNLNRSVIWFFFLLICNGDLVAQQFGGNPSGMKWKQLNTDTIRILFPEGLDSTAQRIAGITHYLQKNYHAGIGNEIRKISLVLQPNTTLSNAYVGLAPYRSEFYLTAPQNALELGAQSWADNLAIHEFRHVQQYSNFNHGGSRLMSVLFGQEGQAVANAAAIPDWFFEGDAVYNETMLSRQGRGRLPFFFAGYRALYFGSKQYGYQQLRNGSLRHYLPDHYQLGYLLVAYGREKYGNDFWRKVTADAVRFKPLLYPLQGAVRRYTGCSFTRFTADALIFYRQQWAREPKPSIEWLTAIQENDIIHYRYPYRMADGSLLVLKSSNRSIPAFYQLLPGGGARRIATRAIAYDGYFSYNNNRIVYAALRPDARWGYRQQSLVRVLDVQTGKQVSLQAKGRFFSPDIAHNSTEVAAVSYDAGQHCSLVLWKGTGQPGLLLRAIEGHVFSYPKFSADDRQLYYMERNPSGEMAIRSFSFANDSVTEVLPFANRITGFPVVQGDTLYYTCSNNGRDEVWAYAGPARQHYRLAAYSTGFYQAVPDGNGHLIASAFTGNGFRLARVAASWSRVEAAADTLQGLYVQRPFQPADNHLLAQVPARTFPVSPYRSTTGFFNFHSWRPYYEQPELSVAVYGQNVLNTLQSQLYYTYNYNEGFSKLGYTGVYGGWYLQPVLGISQTWNRNTLYSADTSFYWNELNVNGGLRLPLNFSGGRQYRFLTLSSTVNLQQVNWTGVAKKLVQNIGFSYLESRLQYSSQVQQAAQHIYPRWAQALLLQYRNILGNYTARQFLASGSLYLPGLTATHNLMVSAAYQSRDTLGQYYFSDNFPFSRGYRSVDFPRMWRMSGNYHFPLLYPDRGLGNLVYVQRVRMNLFYDYTLGKSLRTGRITSFHTMGGELYLDTRWWNQQPVSFGIRYSRLLNNNFSGSTPTGVWELVLPVNLF